MPTADIRRGEQQLRKAQLNELTEAEHREWATQPGRLEEPVREARAIETAKKEHEQLKQEKLAIIFEKDRERVKVIKRRLIRKFRRRQAR